MDQNGYRGRPGHGFTPRTAERERMVERTRGTWAGGGGIAAARFGGCLPVGAIVAAPFLALLYGPAAGLTVATLALAATALLAAAAARAAPAPTRRRLFVAAAANGALALACAAALVARLA